MNENSLPILTTEIILWGKNGLSEAKTCFSREISYRIGREEANNFCGEVLSLFPKDKMEFTIILHREEEKKKKVIGRRHFKVSKKTEHPISLVPLISCLLKEMFYSYKLGVEQSIHSQ